MRVAQPLGEVVAQFAAKHRLGQRADSSQRMLGLSVQRVDIVGDFLVGVRLHHRGDDRRQPLGGNQHLDAHLFGMLALADLPKVRVRALHRLVSARARRVEGAASVQPDHTRACVRHRVNHGVHMLGRGEHGEFVVLLRGSFAERAHFGQPNPLRQRVVNAARGDIPVRVDGNQRDFRRAQPLHRHPDGVVEADFAQWAENQRVVRHQQLALAVLRVRDGAWVGV
jgi:hypothetical protein